MKAIFSIIDEHIAEADKQSRAELADNQMDAVRQWRAVVSTLKALRSDIADAVEPPMPHGLREWIEGMTVSVDVSTSEDDADHRYFGTVTEVMDAPDDKHGVTLLVQDAKPNFTAQAPAVGPEFTDAQITAAWKAWPELSITSAAKAIHFVRWLEASKPPVQHKESSNG